MASIVALDVIINLRVCLFLGSSYSQFKTLASCLGEHVQLPLAGSPPRRRTTVVDGSRRALDRRGAEGLSSSSWGKKVDREMALSESTLNKLKKKQEELEQAARGPARAPEPEEQPPRHRSLAESVYADNAKKAASAHAALPSLSSQRTPAPLYNQPQDTEIYHINVRRHRLFRRRLTKYVQRLRAETRRREEALASAYTSRASEWARRVERVEQGQKRKAKESRNREFFEKVFPELRKQREERERFHRLGARVKSEAELEEIADGLHEQEHEDKKMRSLTVVPPLLLDCGERKMQYVDNNSYGKPKIYEDAEFEESLEEHSSQTQKELVLTLEVTQQAVSHRLKSLGMIHKQGRCLNMEVEHKALGTRNVWTSTEREVFREKYLQHPKNFGLIASFLPRKNVQDCVRFYYLSKKAENYKQLLRKPRQRRSNRPRPAPEPELPAGVTTRLQRSQGGTGVRPVDKEQTEEATPAQVVLSGDAVLGIPVPPDIRPMSPTQPTTPQSVTYVPVQILVAFISCRIAPELGERGARRLHSDMRPDRRRRGARTGPCRRTF
ncbi:Nuclear receptor corepressor 2 [Eumeta japonica]|uniref:Nuclear receptor corepressor 2 n=1 Tax=Eumeta variegata TaxID=151549 RepID=A0A4C1Z2V0_EUMVA|nr:Nuclear receptor corepressor 2 [Eumeta japonica]